jgi:cytochrome P450
MSAISDQPLPATLRIDAATRRVRLSAADPAFVQNPYAAYRLIRQACPMFLWEDYGFWCFATHGAVNALFRDRRFGREVTHVASREELGWPALPEHVRPFYDVEAHSMLEREPPAHTRLRTLVNRAFVSRTVERLRPRAEALAHRLIDGFSRDDTIDLLPRFAEVIPVTLIAEMMGIPVEEAPRLLDWSHRMVAMYQFNRSRAVEDDAVAATLAFTGFLRDTIAARRRAPGDDLLSLLLAAEAEGGRLSEQEVVSTAILLLNAGHEATVHAIGNGVAAILSAGLEPETLFATPAGTAACVEELLRFDPPLHLFTRYALEPMEIEGVSLRIGDRIGLLIGAANRDPSVFADPDRLDPGRPPAPHLAFGAGIHFCLGAPLARLELQAALPILFSRLPSLGMAEPPRFADRYHFRGLEALRVSLGESS